MTKFKILNPKANSEGPMVTRVKSLNSLISNMRSLNPKANSEGLGFWRTYRNWAFVGQARHPRKKA